MKPDYHGSDGPESQPHIPSGAVPSNRAPYRPDNLEKAEEAYFGYGDHADVYKGRLNGKLVVIKQLRGVNSNKTVVRDFLKKELNDSLNTAWQHLNHHNVCRIYMIAEGFGFLPALVMDYYQNGSIIKFMEKKQPTFQQRVKWAYEIADGLAHLHSFATFHRDLRSANVFLDDSLSAVLTDYGIAHLFTNSDFTSAKSTGTVRWTGPEVISLPPDPNPKLDKLDVFALGMTILEVFSGKPPFEDKSDTGAIFAIAKNESPKLPDPLVTNFQLNKLFGDCTHRDPDQRPSAQQAASILRPLVPSPSIFRKLRDYFASWFPIKF